MGTSKISLKLLIDTKRDRVLFAEAGKNFVDFLFHFLSLPLGTATRLLLKQETTGSLENLYHSIENLDEAYIQPNQNKDIFLRPKLPAGAPAFPVTLLALEDSPTIQGKAFYKCSNNCYYEPSSRGSKKSYHFSTTDPTNMFGSPLRSGGSMNVNAGLFGSPLFDASSSPNVTGGFSCSSFAFPSSANVSSSVSGSTASTYVTDDPRAVCPSCHRTMTSGMTYVAPPKTGGGDGDSKESGFAKGVVTYMVMDDLEVKPMSTISSITLINKFNVKDLSALKEKAVDIGMNEALKLLKAALESKTVLTSVFLDVTSETP